MGVDIQLYDRRVGRLSTEAVYGRGAMDLFYGTFLGRMITAGLLIRPMISRIYGRIQNHPWSRRQILPFVRQYAIDLDEVIVPAAGFASFNDFFSRRFKPGVRPVDSRPDRLISPADSRLQAFPIVPDLSLQIKGLQLTLPQLLGGCDLDRSYEGGLCLCFRLAPCDYHRFCFVETGGHSPVRTVGGRLHSVSPLALRHKPDILATNYRQWCSIETSRLGTLIQMEVGAMMVASIIQHQRAGGRCLRGQEKGYFQFGGSTILVILEPGRVSIDGDILQWSAKGIETLVRYGEGIGRVGMID